MNGNEKNYEVLSFEELRKKLGMDEPDAGASKARGADEAEKELNDMLAGSEKASRDFAAEVEKELEKQAQSENEDTGEKIITQNGKTFVDITAQYVKKKPEEAKTEEEPQKAPQKKQVRTFNEIFSDFFKNFILLKKDSVRERIRKVVMDISIIAIIGCAVAFGELYRQRQVELNLEEDLKNQIVDTVDTDAQQYAEAWEEVFAQYPDMEFPEGMNLKYSYLYALNQDLVGWIKIANTNLDVQVVQSDDNDYYLRRNFYKENSRYGCPYMDFRNDAKYLSDNTVIYGHHMTDGLMFSNLDKYKTLEGYKDSPVIQFDTLYETYYFKVFAAFITNAEAAEDDGYIFNFTVSEFSSDEKFSSFIDEAEKRSIFHTGVNVQSDDKILTLVTCSYEFNEARLVVMGRLVRENEDITVDVSAASLNTAPKYPQAWYDAKNMANPYEDDEDWTP